jgi:hypothetical protein
LNRAAAAAGRSPIAPPATGCESASAQDLERVSVPERLSIAAVNLVGVINRKTCAIPLETRLLNDRN